MQWFKHDTNASTDDAIVALRLEHGGAAVDAYWTLLEQIYSREEPFELDENQAATKSLTYRLAVAYQQLETWVFTMLDSGLLERVNDADGALVVTSTRAETAIGKYNQKCETARQNGAKGGRKSRRKRSASKSEPNRNQSAKRALSGREDILDKDKEYIKGAPSGAVAVKTAPLAAPRCPSCGCEMQPTNTFKSGTRQRLWQCPKCREEAYGHAS